MPLIQKYIVEDPSKASPLLPQHVALVNPDGTPVELGGGSAGPVGSGMLLAGDGVAVARDADTRALTVSVKAKGVTAAMIADGVIPAAPGAATTTAAGLVRKASGVAAVASADAAAAAGEAPTKAEFDAAVAVANECKGQLNDLLSKLKAAGVTA